MKRTIWTIAIVVAVLGAVTIAVDLYWNEFFPRRFFVVEEGTLFRGARQRDRALEGILKKRDCRTVLSLTGAVESNAEVAREHDANYLAYNWKGNGVGPFEEYLEAARILGDETQQPVFYHCAGGRHRTNAATFAYLIETGVDPEQALDRIERYGFDEEHDPALATHLRKYAVWRAMQSESDPSPTDEPPAE